MSFFYDVPSWVYFLLLVGEAALVYLWYRRRTLRTSCLTFVPPVLALALLLVDASVVTEGEKLKAAVDEIAADLSRGRTDALRTWLDRDFKGTYTGIDMDKDSAIAHGSATLQMFHISAVKVTGQRVWVHGDKARHVVHSKVTATPQRNTYSVEWHLHWIKRPDGWRIIRASDPEQLNSF